MIEITDKTLAIWYVDLPGGNWTAVMSHADGERFAVAMRFRWYEGPTIWDSGDRKTGYTVDCGTDSMAQVLDKVRLVIDSMKAIGAGNTYELLRGTGTADEFFEQFLTLPFVHARDSKGNDLKPGARDASKSNRRRN